MYTTKTWTATPGRKKEMTDNFLETYPFRNKPFVHQQAYLQRHWSASVAALFADMGTGKSYMLINNFSMLYDKGLLNGVLIVAPKGVYRNWFDTEIPKHIPEHVQYRMAIWNPQPRLVTNAASRTQISHSITACLPKAYTQRSCVLNPLSSSSRSMETRSMHCQ